MTFQIRKDQLPHAELFSTAVEAHAAALNEYRAHLRGVEEDAANPNLRPEERRIAFPGPFASDLVRGAIALDAVSDKYVPAYELVGPPLAEKKQALFAQVTQMENTAIEATIPAAKRRHWQFRVQDIAATTMPGDRIVGDDAAFIADYNARLDKQSIIQRWAAKLHADIDDLTEATVDSFVVTPFNG